MTKLFSQEEIDSAVGNGQMLLVVDGKVYDCTNFVEKHPGGPNMIRLLVGRDATDTFLVNHPEDVVKRLKCFHVGDVDLAKAPNVNKPLSLEFRKLFRTVKQKGFFDTNYSFFFIAYLRAYFLLALSLYIYYYWRNTLTGCITSAFFLGAFWQQLGFIGHDTGHNGVTHVRKIDYAMGLFVGLNIGVGANWWKKAHNHHHVFTNDPAHDPDTQYLPFFATTIKAFNSLFSTFHNRIMKFDRASRIFVSIQHLTYFPVMVLFARLFIIKESFRLLFSGEKAMFLRKTELLCLLGFVTWYSYLLYCIDDTSFRFLYAVMSIGIASIIHVQVNTSHFAMPCETMTPDEEFAKHQLRSTLDIDCPEWFDWFHGGLQFQVAHHLFPRMPRHSLRQVTHEYVIPFCEKHNLPYHAKTFTGGNVFVWRHLKTIANQVQFLAEVAEGNFKESIKHHTY